MTSAQHNYLLMQAALDLFEQPASELEPEALQKAQMTAERALKLQKRVINAPEAAMVQVPKPVLSQAVAQLKERFDSEQAFESALEANGLDLGGLESALNDELLCDAVLERVTQKVKPISTDEALELYEANPQKFQQPERRYARHILITVNPDFEENTLEQVKARIAKIAAEITQETFGAEAMRHSECPSAMNDGELGWVEKGLLFPELDKKLFTMEEGEISQPIATEVGYHILYCQQIKPLHTVPFEEACDTIRNTIFAKQKARVQKIWLQQL